MFLFAPSFKIVLHADFSESENDTRVIILEFAAVDRKKNARFEVGENISYLRVAMRDARNFGLLVSLPRNKRLAGSV